MLGLTAMPITRSAAKRMRADRKRRQRNLEVVSQLKTLNRKFQKFLKEGLGQEARDLFRTIVKRLDQAASKQILHRNTASRKQARLARQLAKRTMS